MTVSSYSDITVTGIRVTARMMIRVMTRIIITGCHGDDDHDDCRHSDRDRRPGPGVTGPGRRRPGPGTASLRLGLSGLRAFNAGLVRVAVTALAGVTVRSAQEGL